MLERNGDVMSKGNKSDSGKPSISLIPSIALVEEARVLDFGKRKYAEHNWRKGIEWSRIIDGILRHIVAYKEGQTHDPETGISHMAHVRCGAGFLLDYEVNHPELDDRYKGP